jgi:ABC-2 type transport system permease protein
MAGLILENEPVSHLSRALCWFGLYAVYFFIVSAAVLLISAFSRSSWSSLMTGITLWILCVLLIPKFSTSFADGQYPLPSYHEFEHNIKAGLDNGLGNDGSYTERSERYLKQHLHHFNVTTIDQLPEKTRFALDLIQAEAYDNKVNRFYSKQVEKKFEEQQRLVGYMGTLNPLIAVRQLSMGLAGTDIYHHIDFFKKAERYRNDMINRLNKRELQLAISDKGQVGNREFYRGLPDFQYEYPSVGSVVRSHWTAVLSLLLWIVLLMLSLRLIMKRKLFFKP